MLVMDKFKQIPTSLIYETPNKTICYEAQIKGNRVLQFNCISVMCKTFKKETSY